MGKRSAAGKMEEEEDKAPQEVATSAVSKKIHTGAQGFDDVLAALTFSRPLAKREEFEQEFDRIADVLLNKVILNIGNVPHRLVEIEFYYHSDAHADVFAHRDPIQKNLGMWYFHKSGTSYRGGSYKGLDIALGQQRGHAGVLIRSLEKVGELKSLVEGPSLSVDHILKLTSNATIVDLVGKLLENSVSKSPSPLHLAFPASPLVTAAVYKSPRVGLTLKKSDSKEERLYFLMKHYRYFTNPTLKKGKHFILPALHLTGKSAAAIAQLTGTRVDTVHKFVDTFNSGKGAKVEPFFGMDLQPEDFARLYGALHEKPP